LTKQLCDGIEDVQLQRRRQTLDNNTVAALVADFVTVSVSARHNEHGDLTVQATWRGRTGRDAGDDDRHRSSMGGQNISRLLSVDGRTRARRAVPPDQLGNCRAHC